MKSPKVTHLELFPSVEVRLCDYEFKEKSSDNILDAILRDFNKFGVCETSKVVFELKEFDDFDKFSKIKEEVQCRHAIGKKLPDFLLEENSSEGKFQQCYWPSNWTTSVTYTSHDSSQEDFFAYLSKIYELPNLESLAIYGNDQKSLPLSFGTFRKFKKFKLTNTGISAIPQTMFYCIDLEILELEGNSFEVLPFWIAKLKKLQTLSRYHNFLERNINETCFRWQGKAKERLESPKSLAMLSAIIAMIAFPKTVCNQGLPIEVPLNLANLLASLRFCDNCSKALPNECKSIITNSAVLYANLANKAQNNW